MLKSELSEQVVARKNGFWRSSQRDKRSGRAEDLPWCEGPGADEDGEELASEDVLRRERSDCRFRNSGRAGGESKTYNPSREECAEVVG